MGQFLLCCWPLRAPTPLYSILWPIIVSILVTLGHMCNFRDPNLVTFYFYELTHFFRLSEEHFTFHLLYKQSGTFANRKYEEQFYPKNPKMFDPILVTLLKMRLHYSQSSRENINATLSSGTSPLAPCKPVPPP